MGQETMSAIRNDYAKGIQSMIANYTQCQTFEEKKSDTNADGTNGLVRLEIAIYGSDATITSATGDMENVLGCNKSDILGEDIFKYFKLDPSITHNAYNELISNGFCKKQNTIYHPNGKKVETESILTWGKEGKTIIERIWIKK